MSFRLISHAPVRRREVLPVVVEAPVPAAEPVPAADPAPAEQPETTPEPWPDVRVVEGVATAPRPRRRARKNNGEFRGDDPATAEVNEAFVEEAREN